MEIEAHVIDFGCFWYDFIFLCLVYALIYLMIFLFWLCWMYVLYSFSVRAWWHRSSVWWDFILHSFLFSSLTCFGCWLHCFCVCPINGIVYPIFTPDVKKSFLVIDCLKLTFLMSLNHRILKCFIFSDKKLSPKGHLKHKSFDHLRDVWTKIYRFKSRTNRTKYKSINNIYINLFHKFKNAPWKSFDDWMHNMHTSL